MKTSKDWLSAYIIYINIYHLDISSLDKYHPKNGWRGSLVSEWRKLKETLQHWAPEIGKLGKKTLKYLYHLYQYLSSTWHFMETYHQKNGWRKIPWFTKLSLLGFPSPHVSVAPPAAHPALAAGRLWLRRITAPGGGAFCGRGCLRNPMLDHGNHGNHKPQNTSRYGDMDIIYIYTYIYRYHISFMLV